MEDVKMIEKLMEKADVTFEEAKGVLDAVNWNLLDALIALEKEGKIREEKSADYSTKQDISGDIENIRKSTDSEKSFKSVAKKIFDWIKNIAVRGMDNKFCVTDDEDKEWFSVPVTILAVFIICAFWVVMIALLIAFFSGNTFSFEGPDLGTEKVNSFMSKIKFSTGKTKNSDIEIDDRK